MKLNNLHIQMKTFVLVTALVLLLFSCDKNINYGIYEYQINNQSSVNLKIEYFNSLNDDSIVLPNNKDTILVSNWNEMDGEEMRPNYLNADSIHIIFYDQKSIKFSQLSNNLVNGKSILNEYTYDEQRLLSSEKNEMNKRFTFTITEQDYLLAE